jgi:predicted DNA-binding transcriptional regulator AlpA
MHKTTAQKLKTPSAAEYCGSSASTLEKLRISGGGPRYIKIGRRVVYDIADLDRWLSAHRRQSTSDSLVMGCSP